MNAKDKVEKNQGLAGGSPTGGLLCSNSRSNTSLRFRRALSSIKNFRKLMNQVISAINLTLPDLSVSELLGKLAA